MKKKFLFLFFFYLIVSSERIPQGTYVTYLFFTSNFNFPTVKTSTWKNHGPKPLHVVYSIPWLPSVCEIFQNGDSSNSILPTILLHSTQLSIKRFFLRKNFLEMRIFDFKPFFEPPSGNTLGPTSLHIRAQCEKCNQMTPVPAINLFG